MQNPRSPLAALAASFALPFATHAQGGYPNQPIKLLLAEGSLPGPGTPQQAAQLLKNEQQRWGQVVREAKVKVD